MSFWIYSIGIFLIEFKLFFIKENSKLLVIFHIFTRIFEGLLKFWKMKGLGCKNNFLKNFQMSNNCIKRKIPRATFADDPGSGHCYPNKCRKPLHSIEADCGRSRSTDWATQVFGFALTVQIGPNYMVKITGAYDLLY